jgi:hypothetical protein
MAGSSASGLLELVFLERDPPKREQVRRKERAAFTESEEPYHDGSEENKDETSSQKLQLPRHGTLPSPKHAKSAPIARAVQDEILR